MSDDDSLPDLAVVEDCVRAAISGHPPPELRLLGHGEVSIVLGWPAADPSHAVKRVPPFRNRADALQYIDACDRFLDLLRESDVAVWPTSLHTLQRDDGSVVVYHRQPVAPADQIGSTVLASSTPDAEHPLLAAIVRAAVAVTRPGVGFDVQASNWVWDGGTAHQIDFTSPFLLTATGDDLQFDTGAFLREYPAVLRPILRRELLKLIQRFTTVEGAVGDMVGNLQKLGLHKWVDPAIEAARRHAGVVIDRAATTKMFEDDAKLMPLTLKLKKGQRWWLAHTGRQYDSLLPERTTYGR